MVGRKEIKKSLRTIGLLPAARVLQKCLRAGMKVSSLVLFHVSQAIARRRYRSEANGLPIPPLRLNYLVTGIEDVWVYVRSGQMSFSRIQRCLERQGLGPREFRNVLDFGCGSGRVIRYWKRRTPARVHGADYNRDSIRWCRNNLKFARFQVNAWRPPLPYPAEAFDFIYAISVFTHLDEPSQLAWMAELKRVLEPGGHLLFTVHGVSPYCLKLLSAAERSHFARGELVVRNVESAGQNVCGVFHPEEYVRERLVKGFRIRDFLPGDPDGDFFYQDAYLLQKPSSAARAPAAGLSSPLA